MAYFESRTKTRTGPHKKTERKTLRKPKLIDKTMARELTFDVIVSVCARKSLVFGNRIPRVIKILVFE